MESTVASRYWDVSSGWSQTLLLEGGGRQPRQGATIMGSRVVGAINERHGHAMLQSRVAAWEVVGGEHCCRLGPGRSRQWVVGTPG